MPEYLRYSLKTGHVIYIPEGSAEEVIMKKLLESNNLIFKNGDIYKEDKLIRTYSRTRQGRKFARENLEMDYGKRHINILRILDSKREKFNLGKVYDERIQEEKIRIFDILTRPEIEILIIINEGHYEKFTNRKGDIGASTYCKKELKMREVKNKKFVSSYFNDIDILINSIKRYKELHSGKNEYCLFDLLDIW